MKLRLVDGRFHERMGSARAPTSLDGEIVVERKIKAVQLHRTLALLQTLGASFLLTLIASSEPEPTAELCPECASCTWSALRDASGNGLARERGDRRQPLATRS